MINWLGRTERHSMQIRKYAPDMKTTRTIYHVLLRDPQRSEAISYQQQGDPRNYSDLNRPRSLSPNLFFFSYLSIFTLSVAGRLPIWCSSPVVGLTFQHLQSDLLRFPFPSWIADTEHRISPKSSPVKSRKTSAINHSPSSFRFRWGNATRTKSGAKPLNPNSKWV